MSYALRAPCVNYPEIFLTKVSTEKLIYICMILVPIRHFDVTANETIIHFKRFSFRWELDMYPYDFRPPIRKGIISWGTNIQFSLSRELDLRPPDFCIRTSFWRHSRWEHLSSSSWFLLQWEFYIHNPDNKAQ